MFFDTYIWLHHHIETQFAGRQTSCLYETRQSPNWFIFNVIGYTIWVNQSKYITICWRIWKKHLNTFPNHILVGGIKWKG